MYSFFCYSGQKPSSQYDIKPRVMHQNRNTFYLDALDARMYYWTQHMALRHIVNHLGIVHVQ